MPNNITKTIVDMICNRFISGAYTCQYYKSFDMYEIYYFNAWIYIFNDSITVMHRWLRDFNSQKILFSDPDCIKTFLDCVDKLNSGALGI